jgi:hypothetical protein
MNFYSRVMVSVTQRECVVGGGVIYACSGRQCSALWTCEEANCHAM